MFLATIIFAKAMASTPIWGSELPSELQYSLSLPISMIGKGNNEAAKSFWKRRFLKQMTALL
jgi:hypothetical protein